MFLHRKLLPLVFTFPHGTLSIHDQSPPQEEHARGWKCQMSPCLVSPSNYIGFSHLLFSSQPLLFRPLLKEGWGAVPAMSRLEKAYPGQSSLWIESVTVDRPFITIAIYRGLFPIHHQGASTLQAWWPKKMCGDKVANFVIDCVSEGRRAFNIGWLRHGSEWWGMEQILVGICRSWSTQIVLLLCVLTYILYVWSLKVYFYPKWLISSL